ncbi:hypothetical protein MASR1M45_01500 [Candidatus Kapaibacterium sp.]
MRKLFIFTLVLFITACATGRIESLKRQPNESIIIANISVTNIGIIDEPVLTFETALSGKTATVKPDDFGYIYFRVPDEPHFLSRVGISGGKYQNIPQYFLQFIPKDGGIYYIGDITLGFEMGYNWGMHFGLIGALAYDSRDTDNPSIEIKNNYESARRYFLKLFPDALDIKELSVKYTENRPNRDSQPDSLSKSYKRRKMIK